MADNAMRRTAGSSAKTRAVGTGELSRGLALGALRQLVPDVSLHRGMGFAALAAAALIGAAASLGAIAMAGGANEPSPASYVVSLCAAGVAATSGEDPFLAENQAAMATMMAGMAIKPSGDVDRDFVAMMVPHHQGGIDMARAELRYGHNEQLRRLAQEIIVTQQQEIVAMRLALGQPLPPSLPTPDQGSPVAPHSVTRAPPPTTNLPRSPQ